MQCWEQLASGRRRGSLRFHFSHTRAHPSPARCMREPDTRLRNTALRSMNSPCALPPCASGNVAFDSRPHSCGASAGRRLQQNQRTTPQARCGSARFYPRARHRHQIQSTCGTHARSKARRCSTCAPAARCASGPHVCAHAAPRRVLTQLANLKTGGGSARYRDHAPAHAR